MPEPLDELEDELEEEELEEEPPPEDELDEELEEDEPDDDDPEAAPEDELEPLLPDDEPAFVLPLPASPPPPQAARPRQIAREARWREKGVGNMGVDRMRAGPHCGEPLRFRCPFAACPR